LEMLSIISGRLNSLLLLTKINSPFKLKIASPVVSPGSIPIIKDFSQSPYIYYFKLLIIMRYPPEVLTKSKKGKIEVRALIDKGQFVRYGYLDPKTAKPSGKIKLVLKGKKQEEFFIIPMAQPEKFLMLKTEAKGKRSIWSKGK